MKKNMQIRPTITNIERFEINVFFVSDVFKCRKHDENMICKLIRLKKNKKTRPDLVIHTEISQTLLELIASESV
jgi:hypothetical protein